MHKHDVTKSFFRITPYFSVFLSCKTQEIHLSGKHGALGVNVPVLVTQEFSTVLGTALEQFLGCHLIVNLKMDLSQKAFFVILDLVHQVSSPIFYLHLA